ncbi:unnamed protein product [Arabis nemorensis]|uniref:Uncharacterized protein n=1 Tax=Arabis nemorensis TaxID=586526 RepID=A0A565CGQ0_9BRAS|nr:unnamed protein product [Arabis nemorensis]
MHCSESCYWQAQTSSYDSLEFSSGSPDGLDLAPLEDLNPYKDQAQGACFLTLIRNKALQFERNSAEESFSGRSSTVTTTGGGAKIRSEFKKCKAVKELRGEQRMV